LLLKSILKLHQCKEPIADTCWANKLFALLPINKFCSTFVFCAVCGFICNSRGRKADDKRNTYAKARTTRRQITCERLLIEKTLV